MSDFWNNEINNNVSEYDMVQDQEEYGEHTYEEPDVVEYEDIDDEFIDSIQEESAFELNEGETRTVYNARLRLEQAKLYELLINHNLFENVEADVNAINNVQKELKSFIMHRLEILLGIKKNNPVPTEGSVVSSPFNEMEVEWLKALAFKGTHGATQQIEQKESEQVENKPSPLKQISKPKKKAKIKNLSQTKHPVRTKQSTEKIRRKVRKKPKKSKQKVSAKLLSQKIVEQKGDKPLTNKEWEAIAKEDLAIQQSRKRWEDMSDEEREQHVLDVNERHKRPKSPNVIPTAEQQAMVYLNRQMQAANTPKGKFNNFVQNLIKQKAR